MRPNWHVKFVHFLSVFFLFQADFSKFSSNYSDSSFPQRACWKALEKKKTLIGWKCCGGVHQNQNHSVPLNQWGTLHTTKQQASVCCLLVMRVTLCSGLGPAWNVDQYDLMAGRTALCVVYYPQSPIPAKPLSPVTLVGLCLLPQVSCPPDHKDWTLVKMWGR